MPRARGERTAGRPRGDRRARAEATQLVLVETEAKTTKPRPSTGKATRVPKAGAVPAPAPAAAPAAPAPPARRRAPGSGPTRRRTAQELASGQREISVSEFFTKNRHLLGFDNPAKALLTTVKEAVDNSFDACEEAGILPEITISLYEISETRYRVVVEDNGPGIVRQQIPKVFGQLLYGSKFHRLRQSLAADEPVLVERAGRAGAVSIGSLVDELLGGEALGDGDAERDVSRLGLRVPAFDWVSLRYAWRPVSHVIRHRRENGILEILTADGRRVRVTGCHSLFTCDRSPEQVRVVEGRRLRPGDFILGPRRLDRLGTGRPAGGRGVIAGSDLCLLEVRDVRRVPGEHPHVYDLSVPGCENFVAGAGFLACHNSRGQQGIGISAAGMYGQLTTGKPIVITSRTGGKRPAHHFQIQIDTRKNQPVVVRDNEVAWEREHGTRVEIEIEATYKKGRRSVNGYIEMTALANPHATIIYHSPKGEVARFERATEELPREPKEIKPHPHGVELGILMKMLKDTRVRNVQSFLTSEFSRVSAKAAAEILGHARLAPTTSPARVHRDAAEALFKAINAVKLMAPPTNCLSPIGAEALAAGLRQQGPADFVTAVTRPPAVYRGNPFQVEVGIAYGGERPADELAELVRFANRVPLLYQQSACAITRGVLTTSWRSYGIQQSKGALPTAPMLVMVHIASAWVPFTSESKEAIASYPEILKEIRLGLQECGRRLGAYIRKGAKLRDAALKRSFIEKYIPHIGIALREILDLSERDEAKVVEKLKGTLERSRTPI